MFGPLLALGLAFLVVRKIVKSRESQFQITKGSWPRQTNGVMKNGETYYFAIPLLAKTPNLTQLKVVASSLFDNLKMYAPGNPMTSPPTPQPADWSDFLSQGYVIGTGKFKGARESQTTLDMKVFEPVGGVPGGTPLIWTSLEEHIRMHAKPL